MEPNDIITAILSLFAIAISIITFRSQKAFNKHSLRAVCRIDVYSSKESVRVIFRNVGNGVMKVKTIHYTDSSSGQKIDLLSEWLKDIPCATNTEYNLDNTWIGTSMSYNLLSRTVATQADLDKTWERLKSLDIKVIYENTFEKEEKPYKYDLGIDYKIYSAARGNRDIVSTSDCQCLLCKTTPTDKEDK